MKKRKLSVKNNMKSFDDNISGSDDSFGSKQKNNNKVNIKYKKFKK